MYSHSLCAYMELASNITGLPVSITVEAATLSSTYSIIVHDVSIKAVTLSRALGRMAGQGCAGGSLDSYLKYGQNLSDHLKAGVAIRIFLLALP